MKKAERKMKQSRAVTLLFALALLFHEEQFVRAQASSSFELQQKIDEVLADKRLYGAISAVSIRDANSGEMIFSRLGDIRLKAASNIKLLTGAAALETLGPHYTFKTELLTDGKVKGSTLRGNLYLKGKGDPTLLPQDFDQLANELKRMGIQKVTGDLIADDTWYDDRRLSDDVMLGDEAYYYGAPISALTASPNQDYDAGSVIVEVNPLNSGEKARVTLTPETDHVTIINRTKTVEKEGVHHLTITRKHGTNNILAEGTIPMGLKGEREWIAVLEPTDYAISLFRVSLERAGISIKGNTDVHKTAPRTASILYKKESMPLSSMLIPYMKLSNNIIADMLVKEMGQAVHKEGSSEKGLEVVRDYMRALSVHADTICLRDGSGISHISSIPANELSKLLVEVRKEEWYPFFLQSLPVAGASDRFVGGTLRRRMIGTAAEGNVKAKTGTMTGVTSLAGYVTTKAGQELAFSIILNNFLDEDVKDIEDKIAVILAEYDKGKGGS